MKKIFWLAVLVLPLFLLSCSKNSIKSLIDPDDEVKGTDYSATTQFVLVDMGTSVKWATMNLGSATSYDTGDYFNFGNLGGIYENYPSVKKAWRVPTKTEWEELYNACRSKWGDVKGTKGLFLTSTKTGNTIFFPAKGFQDPYGPIHVGERCCYWSTTPISGGEYAYGTKFQQGALGMGSYHITMNALTVRLVSN